MKFGDKYELLESLTTGGVETFIANDKIRGERVLVHILHCDPQKQNQPTVQWVLESFRRVAPEPAALVLETGRYSGTLYAYLVSKLPDEPTLKAWVDKYEAQAKDTQEFPRLPAIPTAESEAPTAEVGEKEPKQPEHPPGPVTQLFREFDLQAKSGTHAPPVKETELPSRPLPNLSGSGDKSGVRPAAPWDPEPSKIPAPPKASPSVALPSDSFRPEASARAFPQPPAPPKDGPKPGEFTSFFQGPFRGDRPLETPTITPKQEAPKKSVGDFTAMFGPVKPQPEEPPPAPGIAGNEPAGTGFTGWFSPELPSRTSSTTSPPPSMGLPRAVDPAPVFPEPQKEPVVAAQPPSFVAPAPPVFPTPVPLVPPIPKPPVITPSSLPSDGATRAFARPNFDAAAPAPPPLPSGPSAYTQVISMKAMKPPTESPAAPEHAAAPKLPTIAMPAPPPPPKLDLKAPAPPPVSYWPLILTLTVLFFIAVLLVLYFVLKH